jgi:hypothetical protein
LVLEQLQAQAQEQTVLEVTLAFQALELLHQAVVLAVLVQMAV